jgi:glycopeptide antibiotics resistance protein
MGGAIIGYSIYTSVSKGKVDVKVSLKKKKERKN